MLNTSIVPANLPSLAVALLLALTSLEFKAHSAGAPPTLTCPGTVTVECAGGLTPVLFAVTATDSGGAVLAVNCMPPSGTGFRLGTSNVVCMAMDFSGNTATCGFMVRAVDTTPPAIFCPADMTVQSTNGVDALVHYLASATDPCGLSKFDCIPRPGTIFPIGVTTVRCDSTDTSGNTNFCTFRVEVKGEDVCGLSPCEAVQRCIDLVDASGIPQQRKHPLVASLTAACASFDRGNYTSGLNQLQAFESKVLAQISPAYPAVAQSFLSCAGQIVECVESTVGGRR